MREEDAGKSCLRINNGQPLKVMRAQKPMIGQTVDHLVDWEELRTSPVGQSTKATSVAAAAAATGRSGLLSVAKRMETSSTTQKHFRESETKRDEELVQSLIQQIEQLQRDVVAKDREMAEMRKQKENEAADVEQMRQQNRDLETALGVEKVERENAVSEERRRGAMREERLQVDKLNLQRQFDESRVQIEALQCSLNDLRVQKSNIEELLSDAEATIERYKEREQTEVLRIASHDIQLTDRKLGGGSYGEVRIGYWRDCPVAVKILYKDLISSPFYIRLLQQEVSVAYGARCVS
ncbi:centrosome-associated protein CEP250-like [Corticium candelabrum]|uniref:centrosome-associated protein CEP250-like n=1 Tax=Corticium candelabrum TaxID=121492 RepID=UPI002E25B4D4|nr:centrosome-associated protein CEP250-like [Corticium candelabrum]